MSYTEKNHLSHSKITIRNSKRWNFQHQNFAVNLIDEKGNDQSIISKYYIKDFFGGFLSSTYVGYGVK